MKMIVSNSPDQAWDKWLKELNGNVYHSVSWAETQSVGNRSPFYFLWLDSLNQILAIAVGIQRQSSIPLLGRFSKHLEFGTYPANRENSDCSNQNIIQQIHEYAIHNGFSSLKIQSYYASMRDSDLKLEAFESSDRLEFLIDLTLTDEQLTKNLSTNHRRKLNKAKKVDLKHRIGRDLEAMRVLRSLQVISRDRRIDRGEEIATAEDSYFEEFGKAYFKRNLGEVHYLTHNGNAVSAAFISIYNKKAYYVFGGSNDDGFAMNAPALLFMNIFSHCRELGCLEFNMGGLPANSVDKSTQSHGLYRFKSGFGGLEIPCFSFTDNNLQPGRDFLFKLARKILRGR